MTHTNLEAVALAAATHPGPIDEALADAAEAHRPPTLLDRPLVSMYGHLQSEDWRLRLFAFDDEGGAGWQATATPGPDGGTYVQLSGRGATPAEAENELRSVLRAARDLAEDLLEDEPLALIVSDDHGRAATLELIAALASSEQGDPAAIVEAIRARLLERHPELAKGRA